jgi:hypothetical protein
MKSALLGTDYEIHPLAKRMPEMEVTEFNLLKESIQRDGLLQPIVLYEGKILDGRHRYRACRELQIVAQFVKYRGSTPATFVFGNNVPRRHLSVSEKLRLADLFLPDIQSEPQKRQAAGTLASADAKGKTSEITAKLIGVSPATVDRDLAIKRAIQRLEAAGWDDAAWKVQEAAAKSVRSGAAAAKAAETMLDAQPDILNRWRNILSAEELRAVELGILRLSTEDLRLWMASRPEEAEQMKHLVFGNRWTVKKAIKFIRDEIDHETTVAELINRCLAARGKFEITVNTFRITIVKLDPKQRQK